MGSWIRCRCDELIHTNLFCGTGISLEVTENFLDQARESQSAEDLVSEIIRTSKKILTCKNCGRMAILHEDKNMYEIKFFSPEA
jgi:hypothetical protein